MPRRLLRFTIPALAGAAVAAVAAVTGCARKDVPADRLATATPIKHLVVLYGENVSFDHYFGTYPKAANPPGAPAFTALPNTPAVDGYTDSLLTRNPNLTNEANGSDASNPFRIARTQAPPTSRTTIPRSSWRPMAGRWICSPNTRGGDWPACRARSPRRGW
jgi:phospholipase C